MALDDGGRRKAEEIEGVRWRRYGIEREALAPLWRQREEAAATRLEELLSLSARATGRLASVEGGGG